MKTKIFDCADRSGMPSLALFGICGAIGLLAGCASVPDLGTEPVPAAAESLESSATFARADSLVIGALLAQRERTGGWGREVNWALPVAIVSGVCIVAIS